MNAQPLLKRIMCALRESKLEAVMIRNSAAALLGAPVTTLDFDFFFRRTSLNINRLKRLSKILEATIFRPYYPTSGLYRVVNDAAGLQLNFLYQAHGIKSFASLRSRALCLELFGDKLLVASFEDIIKSKQLADRQVDRAVLPTLRKAMHQAEIQKGKKIGAPIYAL